MKINWKYELKTLALWLPFLIFTSFVLNLHVYNWQYWGLLVTVFLVRISDSVARDHPS